MAENDDVPGTPDDDASPPVEPAADQTTGAGPVVLKTRWRDRAWSFRAMLAVAAATLVIGGVAGGLVGAAVDDDHDDGYRMGPGGPGMHMPPGWRGRGFDDGGPRWRWQDGPQQPPDLTPYGGPSASASPSAPGSTG